MKKFYDEYDVLISYTGKGQEPAKEVSECYNWRCKLLALRTIRLTELFSVSSTVTKSQGEAKYNSLAKSTVDGLDGSQPQFFYLGYHFPTHR